MIRAVWDILSLASDQGHRRPGVELKFLLYTKKSTEALVPNNSGVGGSDTAIIVSPLDGYQVTALRQD